MHQQQGSPKRPDPGGVAEGSVIRRLGPMVSSHEGLFRAMSGPFNQVAQNPYHRPKLAHSANYEANLATPPFDHSRHLLPVNYDEFSKYHHAESRFSQPVIHQGKSQALGKSDQDILGAWKPVEEKGNYYANTDFPSHFKLGSLIQLSNGDLKRVESLTTEDFLQSAQTCKMVRIDHSVVTSLEPSLQRPGLVCIAFSVANQTVQVAVEATMEHPFFVVGQGWSSSSPDRTLARYQLPTRQLTVGDVCISLAHVNHADNDLSAENGKMRPPPPPEDCILSDRRRSSSASPSDKLLLKRAISNRPKSSTGLASSPINFHECDPHQQLQQPVKKRKFEPK